MSGGLSGTATSCMRKAVVPVILSLLTMLAFIVQWWQLRSEGLLARFEMISKYEDAGPNATPGQAHHSVLYQLLDGANLLIEGNAQISDLLKIQEWLGNQVAKVEVPTTGSESKELLALAQVGGGLACGAMAKVFHDLLSVQGVRARQVQLYRSNFEPSDTHVLVEARLAHGRWVAFDPTFNLTTRTDTSGR